MTNQDLRLYARVPVEQRELLWSFRANHPYTEINVNGSRWRYIACGQGHKTLLFLAGGFLRADMWFYSILALEGRYRILAPDSYTLQEIHSVGNATTQTFLAMLAQEKVERVIPIGLSAGGGIAQMLIQEYPERVEHLVLSHTGVIEGGAEHEQLARRLVRLVRVLPLFVSRWFLVRKTAGRLPPSSQWAEFHNAYFREASARITKTMLIRFLEDGLELRRSFSFKPEALASWPGQVLLLNSKDDQVTMKSLPKLQVRFPRARAHLLEEGGHHTFMLFPEAYAGALERFLDELPVSEPRPGREGV